MKRLLAILVLLLFTAPAWAQQTRPVFPIPQPVFPESQQRQTKIYTGYLQPETLAYLSTAYASSVPPTETPYVIDARIKAIKYGSGVTMSSVSCYLSQVDGTAFITGCTGWDPRQFVGFKGTWSDVGTAGVGFFGSAGTGETLGATEYSPDPGFANAGLWTAVNAPWAVAGNVATAASPGDGAYIYKASGPVFTIGWLLKSQVEVTVYTSGTFRFSGAAASPFGFGSLGVKTWYATLTATSANLGWGGHTADPPILTLDNNSFKQVLTPSVTGTTITTTKGGAQNWTTKGTTPNAATFNVVVTVN